VLEHVGDARICMDEIARVVKPGGAVYVTVPFFIPHAPRSAGPLALDAGRAALFDARVSGNGSGNQRRPVLDVRRNHADADRIGIFEFLYLQFDSLVLGWLLWPLKFLDYLAWRSKRADRAAGERVLRRKERD